jgi:hypothetical protein
MKFCVPFTYLRIYGLFNKAVSTSDYKALNDMMIDK